MLYMEHKENEFLHYFPPKKLVNLEVFFRIYILFKFYFFVTILHRDCKGENIKERREV